MCGVCVCVSLCAIAMVTAMEMEWWAAGIDGSAAVSLRASCVCAVLRSTLRDMRHVQPGVVAGWQLEHEMRVGRWDLPGAELPLAGRAGTSQT